MSRLTASSTAQRAASTAVREPSMPTTTAGDGEGNSRMVALLRLRFVTPMLWVARPDVEESKVPGVRATVLRPDFEPRIDRSPGCRGRYGLALRNLSAANQRLGRCGLLDQARDDLSPRPRFGDVGQRAGRQ